MWGFCYSIIDALKMASRTKSTHMIFIVTILCIALSWHLFIHWKIIKFWFWFFFFFRFVVGVFRSLKVFSWWGLVFFGWKTCLRGFWLFNRTMIHEKIVQNLCMWLILMVSAFLSSDDSRVCGTFISFSGLIIRVSGFD